MNQQQRNLRHAAAEAFIESLDQLQQTLQSADQPPAPPIRSTPVKRPEPPVSSPAQFDLGSFEQAVADIEQFIQANQAAKIHKNQPF
ncbi:hypothetical protein ACN4EK_07990 [Pantanalinema rosaneae CENA516]|uniref:hypothetical protein n=1 Tax=Pantanalinema rosaneae TaxID=1620701 RepID=UPI003D6FA6A7